MKLIKMFALAALAALMAIAFASASLAVAETTALCDIDPGTGSQEVCPSGHLITHVHETSTTKAKLLSAFPTPTVECDVLFLGETVQPLRAPLLITGNFTYTNCGSCTVTEENGPSIIEILKLGHETADVLLDFLIHVECGESLNCSFHPEAMKGTAKGRLLSIQNNGEVSFQKQLLPKEPFGFLCPETTKLDLTTTPLSTTHITN